MKTSLELMGEDGDYRIRDQQNLADIQHRTTKARLRVAGSDNRRAHGWRFNLAIVDEPSQHGPHGEMLAAAIRTALGKRKDARVIYISTRPASDSHFFARLLGPTNTINRSSPPAKPAPPTGLLQKKKARTTIGPRRTKNESRQRSGQSKPHVLTTPQEPRIPLGSPPSSPAAHHLAPPGDWHCRRTPEPSSARQGETHAPSILTPERQDFGRKPQTIHTPCRPGALQWAKQKHRRAAEPQTHNQRTYAGI